ncbi:MAG TPA: ABC transporter substrate-binding protein [Kiritimatiellia bacterium]|nr:ABC transporter substrate-binding protein [Kiritimatiellia bacterium]HMO99914.1 ABC transporter substrate-binding protein [Kiritimatiellia bacterium]HMP96055.1 ABC transporter substrate-binding protein [Kiritimatiellia bacterium]
MNNAYKRTIATLLISAVVISGWVIYKSRHQESVTIGAVIPLTGPGSFVGELINRGLQLGFADTAPSVRLNIQDSGSNPTKGLSAYRHLRDMQQSTVNIVALSSVINAVLPSALEEQTLLIGTATVLPDLPKKGPNVIRYFPSANQLAGQLADYAIQNYRRIAVLYVEDEYGKQSEQVFTSRLAANGLTPVFRGGFPLAQAEARDIAARVVGSTPDVVFIPGYGPNYLPLIEAIKSTAPGIAIFADIQLTVPEYIKSVGEVAEGVVLLASRLDCGIAVTKEAEAFLKQYEAAYGIRPGLHAFISYDLARIVAKSADADADGKEVIKAVTESLLNQSPSEALVPVRIDADGDASFDLIVCRIEGGKLVPATR